MRKLLAVLFFAVSLTPAAHATSGPGCLIVTNVADDDALNMRSRPSASVAHCRSTGAGPARHYPSRCALRPPQQPMAPALVPGQPLQC